MTEALFVQSERGDRLDLPAFQPACDGPGLQLPRRVPVQPQQHRRPRHVGHGLQQTHRPCLERGRPAGTLRGPREYRNLYACDLRIQQPWHPGSQYGLDLHRVQVAHRFSSQPCARRRSPSGPVYSCSPRQSSITSTRAGHSRFMSFTCEGTTNPSTRAKNLRSCIVWRACCGYPLRQSWLRFLPSKTNASASPYAFCRRVAERETSQFTPPLVIAH
jgi:hypothetical protein